MQRRTTSSLAQHRSHFGHRVLAGFAALILAGSSAGAIDRPIEGFGASTVAGNGGETYVVTTLADSGPGSLKDAITQPNRYITFAVGGTIVQESRLVIRTHNLTIDGTTAPAPGITLAGRGVDIAESSGNIAHDIIIKNIRVIDGSDNLAIAEGAYNIIIDHCSFRRASDGNVDIFEDAHDITLQYCIFAENTLNVLIRTGVYNVSLHHNLFALGNERNPQVTEQSTSIDIVNNVMYGWLTNYCVRFRDGSTGNVVKNAFIAGPNSDTSDALEIYDSAGPVYVSGNIMRPDTAGIDEGTTGTRFPAPAVEELAAEATVLRVLEEAGTRPLDAEDQGYISQIDGATPTQTTSWGELKDRFAE